MDGGGGGQAKLEWRGKGGKYLICSQRWCTRAIQIVPLYWWAAFHLLSLFPLRLFETLQSLFWSIFGLLNLYVTNVKARHEFTEFIGATMFGTYNVISLVVLLNMLIAMMNNSYQLIAVSHRRNRLQNP